MDSATPDNTESGSSNEKEPTVSKSAALFSDAVKLLGVDVKHEGNGSSADTVSRIQTSTTACVSVIFLLHSYMQGYQCSTVTM